MDRLSQLEDILKETNTKQEFNIVDDFKSLELAFGALKSKDFRKKLKALIEKYENSELTEVRNALLSQCRAGDTQAIRLYMEYFKPATVTNADDGLLEAILSAGEEVFKNEV